MIPAGPRVLLNHDLPGAPVIATGSREACLALSRAIGRGITAMPRASDTLAALPTLPEGAGAWSPEQLRGWAKASGFPRCGTCEDGLTLAVPPNGGAAYCPACSPQRPVASGEAEGYDARTDAALAALAPLGLTENEIATLALALLDQAGLDLATQARVAAVVGVARRGSVGWPAVLDLPRARS